MSKIKIVEVQDATPEEIASFWEAVEEEGQTSHMDDGEWETYLTKEDMDEIHREHHKCLMIEKHLPNGKERVRATAHLPWYPRLEAVDNLLGELEAYWDSLE